MISAIKQSYEQQYRESEKQQYLAVLDTLSDHISFEDLSWGCEKRLRSDAELLSKVTIYFSSTPEQYRYMVKYYALLRLLEGNTIGTVRRSVGNVAVFLRFLGVSSLEQITVSTVTQFKAYLDQHGYSESTKSNIWSSAGSFLRQMNGFDEQHISNPFYNNIYDSHRLVDQKYIPEEVADQLDRVFLHESIPITLQCIYWILRLIPSRISEVLGMREGCMRPFDGHYCVFIPTWKQNGGYREPIIRTIHIQDEGMGGHLLALIRQQQQLAQAYREFLPESKQQALFAYRSQILLNGNWYAQNKYAVASWRYVSYQFEQICSRYHIQDKDGTPYCVTSHQFRHNGITDRLRSGFTLPQIAEMTAHHGTAMLSASYAHLNLFPETLVEPLTYQSEAENPYVLFAGRVLNMDAVTEARLLRNLRAHRVPGGICADVTHCQSGLWSCVDCEHFVPEMEQLPYFKEQVIAWAQKAQQFQCDKQLADNFSDISKRFQGIVNKLEGGAFCGEA